MKAIGELLFYLAITVFTGNVAFNKIYLTTKKETLAKVYEGLPSLQAYTVKLTKK